MTDQNPSTPEQAAVPSPTNPAGWRFETKQVQAGHDPLAEPTHSRAIPIHQTTSYVFESAEQAAARFALSDLGGAGDNIVASPSLYGGTTNLLTHTLPRLGIETRFVADPGDSAAWVEQADERTIAFFGETIPNPRGDIPTSRRSRRPPTSWVSRWSWTTRWHRRS